MSFLLKRKIFFVFFILLFFTFQPLYTVHAEAAATTGSTAEVKEPKENQDPQSHIEENKDSSGFWKPVIDGIGSAFISVTFFIPLLALVILGLFAMIQTTLLTSISVALFDTAIEKGVYNISDIVNNTDSITSTWEIFRNLANVGLIFAVLFIAIQTILRASSYDAKKLLGRVIIAAVLMNFSFFFAAIVVDVSNEMALVVYQEIGKTTGTINDKPIIGVWIFAKYGHAAIASTISKDVDGNHEEIYQKTVKDAGGGGGNPVANFFTSFTLLALGLWVGAIVNLIVAIVLFSITGLIIGRLVAILLLLVLSPIGFAGMVLPSTEKMAKEWRESLIGHCFFLPAFMLFLLVAVKIIDKLPEMIKREESLVRHSFDVAGLTKELTPMIINFLIITGLLLGALKMANSLSSKGSAAIGKISAAVSSGVSGALMGGTAIAGRNTFGAAASALSQNEGVKSRLRSMGPLGGFLSQKLEGVAKSSFDARGSRVFKGVASATGLAGDFAKPFATGKDGFKGQADRIANSMSKTYAAIPDKKIEDTDKVKIDLDKAEKELEAKKEILKEAQKDLAKGAINQTAYNVYKKDHDDAEKAHKKAQNDYRMEQNPAKQTFVSQTNAPVSIKNVWYASPVNKAREVVKKESSLTDAEKMHKESMQALNDIKNAGK